MTQRSAMPDKPEPVWKLFAQALASQKFRFETPRAGNSGSFVRCRSAASGLRGTPTQTADGWFRVFPRRLSLIEFVRNHNRKIARIALAADSQLASLAAHIAAHTVRAKVKAFRRDKLKNAIASARGCVE